MNIGGLGSRGALKQKPTKSCNRCGLRYPEDEPECTHCKDMNDFELASFKESLDAAQESHAKLGSIFFVIALAIGVLMLLSLD